MNPRPLLYESIALPLSYAGVERVRRIGLPSSAWEADVLPLYYTRIWTLNYTRTSAQAVELHDILKYYFILSLRFLSAKNQQIFGGYPLSGNILAQIRLSEKKKGPDMGPFFFTDLFTYFVGNHDFRKNAPDFTALIFGFLFGKPFIKVANLN